VGGKSDFFFLSFALESVRGPISNPQCLQLFAPLKKVSAISSDDQLRIHVFFSFFPLVFSTPPPTSRME